MKKLLPLLLVVALSGCASFNLAPITSAQALAIGDPLASGILQAVLTNNPKYIPIAQKVGGDLAAGSWGTLTLTGINAAIAVSVAKEGGDSTLTAIVTAAVDAGLGGYLEAVAEGSLASDPNAVLVLQALGQAIVTGANAAQAAPKAAFALPAYRFRHVAEQSSGILTETALWANAP